MKIVKRILQILIITAFITGLLFILGSIADREIPNYSIEISALKDKVSRLEVEQKRAAQNVTQSLDKFQKSIDWCEENVKLQNEFLGIEFDNYQKYYLKHFKLK